MRNRRMTKVAVLATSLLISIFTVNATECTVGKAAVMPVAEKHGSAGAFIGKVGDIVLIAGGSDFENAKPWEGGVKSYFDKVWAVLMPEDGFPAAKWKMCAFRFHSATDVRPVTARQCSASAG